MPSANDNKDILEKMVEDYGFTHVLKILSNFASKKADQYSDMRMKEKARNLTEIETIIDECVDVCQEIEDIV